MNNCITRELDEQEITVEREPIEVVGGGAVKSVNGQTGDVVLTAEDVGALSNDPSTLQPYVKKTELSPVSFSGNYDDLINEPEDFSPEDWEQLWQTY